MNLNLEQQVTKAAVIEVYSNAKLGVAGHLVVAFLLGLVFYTRLPLEIMLVGFFLHSFVLVRRSYLIYRFNKIKDNFTDFKEITSYIKKYQFCMLLSGLFFGLFQFGVQSLSIEYHFFILAVLIGLSSGAIYTIGEVLSIYLLYLVAMIGTSMLWMVLQEGDAYNISVIMLLVSGFYSASTSVRYARNFKDMLIKEHIAKEHILEQKIAQEKILEQQNTLHYKANHDSLTDLPNRVLFEDRLNQGIEKAKRNKSVLAVYFIDLDNFKVINDSLGHDVGDMVLQAVAIRIKDILRSHDTLARWGGDEFTVVIEDLNDEHDASLLAQKILAVLKENFLIDNHELYVTTSIGISVFPKDSKDTQNLVKYADAAMYKAKDSGKNNFKFYSDNMTKMAFERVVMEASLRAAISKKEFSVHYQPQIDAKNNNFIGAEALVRWEHPTIGTISPDQFIPLAEETGLVVEIDKLVMSMAMSQFAQWRKDGYDKCVLSLNLAVKYLEQDDYIQNLKENIKKYNMDVRYLVLELTESDVMKNPESSIEKLHELSALGVNIAIDDFGTGYSSLSYLKRLPIDELKIDKSFTDDIPDNEGGTAIVKAIIAMANTIDLTIVAEGVEQKVQKDYLVKNGCNIIQGYYYAKPMVADDMLAFMKGFKDEHKS